jgi:predicted N-formylglutamate amidohydrolase
MRIGEQHFLVTCEHGGNGVPRSLKKLFAPHAALLASHRGWDAGALQFAKRLANALDAPLHYSTTSRLVVDLNRSVHHRGLFSDITRELDKAARQRLLDAHYHPYRAGVIAAIDAQLARGHRVVHLSAHSFTPCLNGVARAADISFLYDPKRRAELLLCDAWRRALAVASPGMRVRRNYPYRGDADGLTTLLRRRYGAKQYLGIEVELNQALFDDAAGARAVVATLCRVIAARAAQSSAT